MTVARQIIAGRTYLLSGRCTQRQMLLRPDGIVEQIYLYASAKPSGDSRSRCTATSR